MCIPTLHTPHCTPHFTLSASPELSSCTSTSIGSRQRGRLSLLAVLLVPPPASGCGSGKKAHVWRLAAEMDCTPTTLRAVPSTERNCLPSLSVRRTKTHRHQMQYTNYYEDGLMHMAIMVTLCEHE